MRFKVQFGFLLLAGLLAAMGVVASPPSSTDASTFVEVGPMTTFRWGHAATLLADGRVLITGGAQRSGHVLSSAEIYDPGTRSFIPAGDLKAARYGHSATLLRHGKVLIAGGTVGTPINSAELYDPAAGTFTPASNMITAQLNHAAVLLPDGKVLIAGGQTTFPPVVAAPAELYDPATGLFASAGSYASRNALWGTTWGPLWPTAILLRGGKVLVAGNNPGELYDPRTDTFSPTGDMASKAYRAGVYWHTSTLLPNGTVLMTGGTDDMVDFPDAEVYDPTTNAFRAIGNMNAPRSLHTAMLLVNGKVLIAGGETWLGSANSGSFGGSLASVEYYDPSTSQFTPGPSMSRARSGHTATLLKDGTVLIAGGSNYGPYPMGGNGAPALVPTAELFVPASPVCVHTRLPRSRRHPELSETTQTGCITLERRIPLPR